MRILCVSLQKATSCSPSVKWFGIVGCNRLEKDFFSLVGGGETKEKEKEEAEKFLD
jgi:hypothetical protein